MLPFIKIVWEAFLDLLYPPYCSGCQKIGNYLCPNCYQSINFIPIPFNLSLENNSLESVYVTSPYEGVIKQLITTYKYKSVKDIGKILARLIWYSTALPTVNLITYVPINKKKYKKRGFNQTEILAKELSLLMNIPCIPMISKVGKHKPQASMNSKEDRLSNLKGAFIISPKLNIVLISNKIELNKIKSILLVDDVITTGTTLNEVTKVIKEIGVKKVYGFAIAHGS